VAAHLACWLAAVASCGTQQLRSEIQRQGRQAATGDAVAAILRWISTCGSDGGGMVLAQEVVVAGQAPNGLVAELDFGIGYEGFLDHGHNCIDVLVKS